MVTILDGKKLKEKILSELKLKVDKFQTKPTLVVILVGDNPASKIYVNNKKKTAEKLGINSEVINYPLEVSEDELLDKIRELNNDKNVTAILVQLPLPEHISKENVMNTISPEKDVDGFTPYNFGKLFSGEIPIVYPCTPRGILLLLDEYKINLDGKNVIEEKMLKFGCVIVDVGIFKDANGKTRGDVDFENSSKVASYISPVPGGVGPMTITSLMLNTVELFEKQ